MHSAYSGESVDGRLSQLRLTPRSAPDAAGRRAGEAGAHHGGQPMIHGTLIQHDSRVLDSLPASCIAGSAPIINRSFRAASVTDDGVDYMQISQHFVDLSSLTSVAGRAVII